MWPKYIIVQAGGKGTRLEYLTRNKPKALTPIGNRPMIFHLFEKFPNQKYIIIGDYKCDVLRRYLKAFAAVDHTVIDAHGKSGTCAGLAESLRAIPEGEPFFLIWCDLVLPEDFHFPEQTANYVGISKDFPCRWSYEKGRFKEERSTERGVAGLFLFEDKSLLADVPEEGEFVRWLGEKGTVFQELPLYHTKEYGLLEEYKKLGDRKCRPFNRITVKGDRLIKEPVDDQGRGLAERERAWYRRVMAQDFRQIPRIYSLDPLEMERISGENIYTYTELSREEKEKVLVQLITCLKRVQALEQVPTDRQSYWEAYIGKTAARLEKVRELVPLADQEKITINGRSCRNIFFHWKEVEEAVMSFLPDTFRLIHGDCTFSNVLLREDGTPVLIDPRGYFGNTELYGDPAYDWAKLYYSLAGNYDQFNLKRFSLDIREDQVELSIESNHWEDMEPFFFDLLKDEVTPRQIKLFHAIIWLSLTTYAWEDYDSICGAFYNGLLYLEDAL